MYLFALLASPVATAGSTVLPPQGLCRAAPALAIVEVTDLEVLWTAEGGLETRAWLHIHRALRGALPEGLEIVQPGGRLGELEQAVEGMPHLEVDTPVLVTLWQHPQQGWQVFGGELGLVTLDSADPGPATLDAAFAALGGCDVR